MTSGWHLVTGTYDGSTATLYVDGAMAASDTFAAPGNTTYPLYIGRYYADNGSGWNGAIDEVHLYNRAVTSAEVSALYGYIPPTISITAPTTSTVSGAVTVSATAGNNVAVADVQFQLDGANLGPDLTTAPYSFSWDTTRTSDGTHTLTAVARDTSGNTATSAAVVVTVSNSVPPTHYVSLTWTDSTSSNLAYYNVYRGTASGGPYTFLSSTVGLVTSYTDYAIQAGQTYYYVTSVVDNSGAESGYSNEAVAVVPTS